ncbi:hypothetical protein EDC04DRAFT_2608378 [Pisolithus marmoratus]|nr:hypothetical protein EDC04DRAFT_2608378 [Pisolithus marmoratus]
MARKNSLADFFNSVIECINNACGMVRVGRKWTTDSATHPLNGGNVVRKPDMACWLASGSEFDWRHLATFAEVKNCRGKDKEKSSYIETAVGMKTLDIQVGNTKFTVKLNRVLFISDNLFGRGTTVWGGIIRGA